MRTKNQTLWELAEDRAAVYFGGEKVRASGMGYHKSDVRQVEVVNNYTVNKEMGFRVEVKSTEKQSIPLQTRWFGKITRESRDQTQLPALFLQFGDLKAFALVPSDTLYIQGLPLDATILCLGEKSTKVTPEQLLSITHVIVPDYIFKEFNCGRAWEIPIWEIHEVSD